MNRRRLLFSMLALIILFAQVNFILLAESYDGLSNRQMLSEEIVELEIQKEIDILPDNEPEQELFSFIPPESITAVCDRISEDEKEKEGPKKVPLIYAAGDSEFRFSGKFRPEFYYGKNLRFLNSDNKQDQILFFRHTLDLFFEYHFGKASKNRDVAMFKMNIRNRGLWGDPESISQTCEGELRRLDIISLSHRHGIPRHILWLRELWLQISLNDILCFPLVNNHTFTLGAFPFELGRGIALGSAYGVGPDLLGFYAEVAIDQYAFGFKLSGDIVKNCVSYDLYTAILDNKAGTFENTNAKIHTQVYGRRFEATRGFGVINFVSAARLKYTPQLGENEKVEIEPYILFNDQREQKLEFVGEASSRLATAGLSGEFQVGDFDFGFDTAFNFGQQKVKGIDRNTIIEQNRNGFEAVVNSKVKQIDPITGKSDLALKVEANQAIIHGSPQCEAENGAIIGSNALGVLVNEKTRFSDPYCVKYGGWMFVFDMGYYLCNPILKINAGVGFASGDENPHKDLKDFKHPKHDFKYNGFISIMELYSGTRVKSAFLLSGSGRIPRILSFPTEEVIDPFPSSVARFTNIIFGGAGVQIKLPDRHKWSINPNILPYWQAHPCKLGSLRKYASRYLGLEINTFIEADLVTDLRFFGVGALFIPGQHYRDIRGRALNKDQQKYIEGLLNIHPSAGDKPLIERPALLGHDISWFLNLGLEYRF